MFLLLIIYGQNVGNFVISISRESDRALTMSLDQNFSVETTRLVADALYNAEDNTLVDIFYRNGVNVQDEYTSRDGSYNDPAGSFLVYNFYLKNVGNENVNFESVFKIDNVYKGVDSAVRIMLVTKTITSEVDDETVTIYAKEQEDENGNSLLIPESYNIDHFQEPIDKLSVPAEYLTTTPFASDTVVFAQTLDHPFEVGSIKKYTIIMWLEGEDAQCTNELFGTSIKFSMNFRVIE